MGPDMRGLDRSWVPLHFAIGWVLTRDRIFVRNLPFDGSTRMLAIAIAIAIAKADGTKAKPIHDGWCAMQYEPVKSEHKASRTGDALASAAPQSKLPNVAVIFPRPRSPMQI